MKLFCLVHAGGDSRYFDKFIAYTENKNIDIVPIEYNGRGKYKKEKINKVSTLTCTGDGLGIENKISY